MIISHRLNNSKLAAFAIGTLLFVLISSGFSQTVRADGHWEAYCNGTTTTNFSNSFGAGSGLAIDVEQCHFPQSNGPSELTFKQYWITATSHLNNLSCQAVNTGIDQPCWGDAAYICPLTDMKDSQGWCITKPKNTAKNSCGGNATTGNPIEISTGRKMEFKTDWTSGGTNPLTFSRTYSSVTSMAIAPAYSRLGTGWRSNFDSAATFRFYPSFVDPTQAHEGDVISIALPDMNEYAFRFNAGTWKLVVPQTIPYYYTWDTYRTDLNYTLTLLHVGYLSDRLELYVDDNRDQN
jgi:Domain of unknown function (DUF6531)